MRACMSSSTGTSFSWPFRARAIAVRLAKVRTTSSGFFSRRAGSPRECVAIERVKGAAARPTSLDIMVNVGDATRRVA